MSEKLIFEIGSAGQCGALLPELDVPEIPICEMIPKSHQRLKEPRLSQVSENEVVRHFVNLSAQNHHVDRGFYPLGSCTMKYNPKVNEETAAMAGFRALHPAQPAKTTQGALELMASLGEILCEISGLEAVTLQPSAGAHGELTGILMVRAFHEKLGHQRKYVLIPDSAHGTNPATVSIAGYKAIQLKSNDEGLVDLEQLKKNLNEETAALMLTNPNTLGIFERQVDKIVEMVHEAGALVYMDGANMNALLGLVRPGDLGVDLLHFNLHKTFSTPHGGGGPGSGPVAVSKHLVDYLPQPSVLRQPGGYRFDDSNAHSIGKVSSFYGNFGIFVRAYTYIKTLGAAGLLQVSKNAILNANYLYSLIKDHYDLPYKNRPMHEFVLSGERQKKLGVKTLDIAKRLLDFGVHAPTVYFPLIVHEAMMIEPTETESKTAIESFAHAMIQIATEAEKDPELLHQAPLSTPVSRMDEAAAARELNITYPFD